MRNTLVLLILASHGLGSFAGEPVEGVWLTCIPEIGRTPYSLYSVERDGDGYRVSSEWGQMYSSSGRVTRVNGSWALRECTYYRGEPTNSCDPQNPPIVSMNFTSPKPMKARDITTAFRRREAIMAIDGSWQKLAAQCEEFVQKLEGKKLEKSP
ncbi:hypothetical protein [Polaromonas aquatica]|uniref:hypothetical protein n=1 Tax=Polaromonas aquatica TaxID=332657 RepID=UPI003D650187